MLAFYSKALHDPGPDIVVADEAHLMLTNTTNKIFSALRGIKTTRRIALTGSPIQNNLFEYFRMVSWVRPGVLGNSEAEFDREYANAITTGLASDASPFAVRTCNEKSKKLHTVLAPYVQRKDAKVLRKDLPPMQQVVLHVRQTKAQVHLYRAFKRYRKINNLTNFFVSYQMIRPVHNHPYNLLISDDCDKKEGISRETKSFADATISAPEKNLQDALVKVSSKPASTRVELVDLSSDSETEPVSDNLKIASTEDGEASTETSPVLGDAKHSTVSVDSKDCPEAADTATDGEETDTNDGRCEVAKASDLPPTGRTIATNVTEKDWWKSTVERIGGAEKLKEVEQGYKIVLLLHILMEAQALGEKVLVFAQCLKTLDFIEYVLGLDDWAEHVPSLSSSPQKMGGWKKGVDYLRIDGQTQFSERGELIAMFNDEKTSTSSAQTASVGSGGQVKAFLLSAKVSH